jgi:Spy/CpxP family protein refolding chaperone
MKTTPTILLTTLALAASTILATAQNAPNPDPNARPDRGGRGNPEDFRQRMNERLKSSLKVTDDEWAAIQPLIEKVQAKQREAMGGRFGGFGGRGPGGDRGPGGGGPGGGGPGGDQSARPGAAESDALRKSLENESTSPEELKTKLSAVREQRKKSAAELAAAREDLRKVLTVRQEAALVAAGILE